MKKITKILSVLIVALPVLILLAYFFVMTYYKSSEKKRLQANHELTKEEIGLIESGDIILRRGYGFISDMIVSRLNERASISHCGIVERTDSTFKVIHAVSQSLSDFDGVQSQNFWRFVNESKERSIIIVRYRYRKGQTRFQVTDRVNQFLARKIPFDYKFDIHDTTKFYCTELIWRVFLDEFNVDIFEKKHGKAGLEFHKFDIFLDTTYFNIVWSHQKDFNLQNNQVPLVRNYHSRN